MKVLLDYACKIVVILLFIVAGFIFFLMDLVLLADKDPIGDMPTPGAIIKIIWNL